VVAVLPAVSSTILLSNLRQEEIFMMNQKRLPTVGILIFDDVEVLDFCGPFEVFSVARALGEHSDEATLFTVGCMKKL